MIVYNYQRAFNPESFIFTPSSCIEGKNTFNNKQKYKNNKRIIKHKPLTKINRKFLTDLGFTLKNESYTKCFTKTGD